MSAVYATPTGGYTGPSPIDTRTALLAAQRLLGGELLLSVGDALISATVVGTTNPYVELFVSNGDADLIRSLRGVGYAVAEPEVAEPEDEDESVEQTLTADD